MGRTRLALALTTSGLVLGATQMGAWSFLPFAVVAQAPLLLAARCLPLAIGLPLVLLVGTAGRALALSTGEGALNADHAVGCVGASGLMALALLADRLCATWLRYVGFLAFPCAAVLLAHIADVALPAAVAAQLHHPAHDEWLDVWVRSLGRLPVEWLLWVVASGTSQLASVHNWFVPDPFTQGERESGIRAAGISGFVAFALLFAIGALRFRQGASTDVTSAPDTAQPFAIVCALALVAFVLAALRSRTKRPRPAQLPPSLETA